MIAKSKATSQQHRKFSCNTDRCSVGSEQNVMGEEQFSLGFGQNP